MAVGFPDKLAHNNTTLSIVEAEEVAGGLKQLADFTTITLGTLLVDKLVEGNLLYITAGANQGNLYKLTNIASFDQTSSWELIGVTSTNVLAALLLQNIDATSITVDDVITTDVKAETSAGGVLKASNGDTCISFGAGGSGNSTLGANMSGASTYKIVNIIDPSSAQDVSTKAYTDNGDNKVSQAFTTVTDANASINFNSEDFTKNYRLNTITADRTWTISNAVNGSQLFIVVNVGSGEENWELIFSGMSSMNIHPDWINGTSNGVVFPGNASAATKYQVIAVYDGTDWWINAIDWN